jgi:hypothetical protein
MADFRVPATERSLYLWVTCPKIAQDFEGDDSPGSM